MPPNITTGPTGEALKALIHGPPGVGKTSLSDLFPGPVMHIDMEGSTTNYPFTRIECGNWQAVDEATTYLLTESHPYKTVVYDTITAWEKFAEAKILSAEKKKRMADFSYGRGGMLVREEADLFVSSLDPLTRKGINVLILGHSVIRRIQPPDLTDGYDKWAIGIDEKAAATIRRWAQAILFLNFRVRVIETAEKKTRGVGGEQRIICTQPDPSFDAKTRFDLVDEIRFEKDVWPEALNPLFSAPVLSPASDELFEKFCEVVADIQPEVLKSYLLERGTINPQDDARAIPEEFLKLVVDNAEGFRTALAEYAKDREAAAV